MVKFEYDWMRYQGSMEDLLVELNERGQEGWEVIYFVTADRIDILLKRVKHTDVLI